MKSESVVIIGAGVIGLNVALVLAEKGYGRHTTIVAEHLPGDTSIHYTSPWAGANFSAISASDPNALRWDRLGYTYLLDLAAKDGKNAFVKETPSVEYWDELPSREKIESMAAYLKDFKEIATQDLPAGVAFGIEFTTITLNAPMHLRYLFQKVTQEYGVRVIRKKLPQVSSGYLSEDTKVVFNCTGNAAKELPGVQDSKCFPTRGQILLARASHVQRNIMRHGKDYETYVIPRPYSNGNVILGGFMQKNVGTPDTFGEETNSILSRTTALLPALNSTETEILGAFAGLRPSREGGARVARENVRVGAAGRHGVVVHNYGAGGTGYQAGYGMAVEAVNTVAEEIDALDIQSRL
ncbi:D-amino-acid oxidase [Penicillium coprophilum]|uniref:D-amino-acid oxidase n=1 Tax=Penicillium coprophilum TaxID=36646 RepID=UPI00239C6C99|nr:D-amino-acid oxidase [Penicillium coprophilum]XP_056533701.1 D-amino-acid oxidase [Penicillium coprophilum]KAJ5163489.1 D-amino-acid oxidase [Penicillium coprophilum]KAJ5165727.1 D-amino-acid oxidase [Penicillium coprophilum]